MEYNIVEKFILRSDVILNEQKILLFDVEAIAGLRELFVGENNIPVDEICVPNIPRCDGAIHVTGDSMYPLLMKGDIILYKRVPNRRGGLFFGQVYILDMVIDGDEFITVKRVFQSETPGYYILKSENPKYPDKEVLIDHVREMAIVKTSMRCLDVK